MDLFLEAGFTYFDTARVCEGSEDAIQEALKERYHRDCHQLAKATFWKECETKEEMDLLTLYRDKDKAAKKVEWRVNGHSRKSPEECI